MPPEDKLARMKAQVYKDPRPAEFFEQFHTRTRTQKPDTVYDVVKSLTAMYSWSFFRLRSIGSHNVPGSGPVILAPNHFSFMDHFFTGAPIRRKVQFMAKSQMFKPPLGWIYTHGGVFPVRRGARDEEAFETAETVLGRGGVVCMYCEGGRSRDGRLAERAKPGIGRLALRTGAPIVPVAIHGSSHVRNWKRGQFPKVVIQFGEPFRFEADDAPDRDAMQGAADEIFGEIKGLYSGLEEHGRAHVAARVREEWRAARRAARKRTATASIS